MRPQGIIQEIDTIFSPATPPGEGGIAVVRISGAKAREVARKVYAPKRAQACGSGEPSEPRKLYRCNILGRERQILDDGLIVFMPGPHSYTGEDIVEIHTHGSPWLLEEIGQVLVSAGARMAEPGEFTLRAYLRGKIDLTQAEAVLDVVEAQSREGLRKAARHLQGTLGERITRIRERLVSHLADLEAEIDFPEEIDPEAARSNGEILAKAGAEVQELLAGHRFGKIIQRGLRVVIVGRPNVGKSSLFNTLLQRERALVDSEPGTTRDVVESSRIIRGNPITLYDTAGRWGFGGRVENLGMKKAREYIENAECALFVLDGSDDLCREDREVASWILEGNEESRPRVVVVINKSDLPEKLNPEGAGDLVPGSEVLKVSALTGEGITGLEEALSRIAQEGGGCGSEWISSVRQYRCLEEALGEISDGMGARRAGNPPEFIAENVRAAVGWLGELLGQDFMRDREEVLTEIFSRFCLGK